MNNTQTEPRQAPATLSWRIGFGLNETNEEFARVQRLLLDYRDIVDEVAFFETITHHLYFPLEFFARRAEMLKYRIESLKQAGIGRVGINVLCTVGHVNEGWDFMPPLPFQAMVGHDGAVSRSCACPNTAGLREYVREKYHLMAKAGPDFIWVDDDIRMHHHGVAFACFCPTCLAIFGKTTGVSWTREALVEALNKPESGTFRQAWVEQNAASLEALLAHVKRAIAEVSPRIATGLMTVGPGWTTYSGQTLGRWMTALGATKTRPGGGFYSDEQPMWMVHKALDCGRQLVDLPATVTDRQYELENFPYSAFSKSVTTLINECTLALASGMNGIAFNAVGSNHPGIAKERKPIFDAVRGIRGYWEQIVRACQGCAGAGLWPAWSIQATARRQVRDGETWFSGGGPYDFGKAGLLAELGLPLTPEASGHGTVLVGRMAEIFSDDELRQMLSSGVFMDAAAMKVLHERGLGDLTGVRLASSADNGVKERLTDDPLNGEQAGGERSAMIEFWGDGRGLGEILEPAAPGTRVLANMVNYLDTVYGPCVTAFENTLGGRVVVAGYGPWMFLGSTAKRTQLQNVADWITRGTLPVRIDEMVKLIPLVQLSADRQRGVVMLLNASFDSIPEATIHVRTSAAPTQLLRPQRKQPQLIEAEGAPGGWTVKLRDVPPWSTVAVVVGHP